MTGKKSIKNKLNRRKNIDFAIYILINFNFIFDFEEKWPNLFFYENMLMQ